MKNVKGVLNLEEARGVSHFCSKDRKLPGRLVEQSHEKEGCLTLGEVEDIQRGWRLERQIS